MKRRQQRDRRYLLQSVAMLLAVALFGVLQVWLVNSGYSPIGF